MEPLLGPMFNVSNMKGFHLYVDPGGYRWPPTYSTGSKTVISVWQFFHDFLGHKLPRPFCGTKQHFFGFATAQEITIGSSTHSTILLLHETFLTISRATQMEIICKSYAPRKLTYQLTTSRPAKLLAFHLPMPCLGFYFPLCFMLKRHLASL